jgi:hypothetical protein
VDESNFVYNELAKGKAPVHDLPRLKVLTLLGQALEKIAYVGERHQPQKFLALGDLSGHFIIAFSDPLAEPAVRPQACARWLLLQGRPPLHAFQAAPCIKKATAGRQNRWPRI